MTDVANAVIVLGIFVVLFGVRWAFRASTREFMGQVAENHPWVPVLVAFGMVIWAVLDAVGVVHETPYRMWRTYVLGGVSALLLIAIALGARAKPR